MASWEDFDRMRGTFKSEPRARIFVECGIPTTPAEGTTTYSNHLHNPWCNPHTHKSPCYPTTMWISKGGVEIELDEEEIKQFAKLF